MKVSEVARIWQVAGVSIIPILANQTKRPAIRWSPYQATIPTLGEVDEWWGNGKPFGLALICGAVSGNLELVEIEGRAMDKESMDEVINRIDEAGAGYIWDRLNGPEGYSEMSPSGGLHLLYRISDHEVPGNEKIARRPATEEELAENPDDKFKVLVETRGRGGYCIVAPTPGICHPSGESWDLINGRYGQLPLITWAERNLLHEALHTALDKVPERLPPPHLAPPGRPSPDIPPQIPGALPIPQPGKGSSAPGSTPGNDYEASTDWLEILEPHGWHLESRHGTERHWTRPGKDKRDGASATTGRASDRDRLYVFSTSTVFDAEVPYTKFGAYALLNHGGDHSAAAKALARLGFGERREVATLDPLVINGLPVEPEDPGYFNNDTGNGEYLYDHCGSQYHWIGQEKSYYGWTGQLWQAGMDLPLEQEFRELAKTKAKAAIAAGNETNKKRWIAAGNVARVDAALRSMRSAPGVALKTEHLNPDRHLLNLRNGVLNLETGELLPHDPSYLMTRMFGASYDPTATCEQFQNFMIEALPDEGMRAYVQRALGYSLLGDVDQRSIFWIYGPPGSGKSTLMDTIRHLFGDYGLTSPSGAFRQKLRENGPSNDLHGLRGKRFVTTSETAESTSFDEDLLKRLSGRDQVSSRALYQDNQEWTPESVLWLATNNPPKFNSDDDAIWRRTKLIPFMRVFTGEGQVYDMSRRLLETERDGILNWLLAGLRDFLAHGLGEPESVHQNSVEQRMQSDSVARFLDDKILDGILALSEDLHVRTSELYAMYGEWARQNGEKSLGNRRFVNRVTSNFPSLEHTKVSGHTVWRGLGRHPNAGILGILGS